MVIKKRQDKFCTDDNTKKLQYMILTSFVESASVLLNSASELTYDILGLLRFIPQLEKKNKSNDRKNILFFSLTQI